MQEWWNVRYHGRVWEVVEEAEECWMGDDPSHVYRNGSVHILVLLLPATCIRIHGLYKQL